MYMPSKRCKNTYMCLGRRENVSLMFVGDLKDHTTMLPVVSQAASRFICSLKLNATMPLCMLFSLTSFNKPIELGFDTSYNTTVPDDVPFVVVVVVE